MESSKFAKFPFNPAKSKFFYGWVIIIIGTLSLLMTIPGQTIGLSTFTDSLIEALGISRDTLSLAYMLGTISSSLLLTKAGQLFDKFGARPVAITASVCLGLGLLYMSATDTIVAQLKGLTGFEHLWIAFPVIFFGFMMIRFFGQGVLTLASRTMMMKWFDKNRGFALGFSSVFVSGGFSIAPAMIESMIQSYSWKGAWVNMAMILIFVFPVLVLMFFRNDPVDVGLKPDGEWKGLGKDKTNRFPTKRDFTLKEARKTLAFWVFAGFLGLYGLYITGFTFHIVSIFEQIGKSREESVEIFQYIAVIAIIVTLIFSWMSDFIKLKYLLYIMSFGAILSASGIINLEYGMIPYICMVVGIGIASGMYGVVAAVCWPRFFGKTHLGSIIGQVMTVLVFGSALGPILFSQSLTWFQSYDAGIWVCLIGYVFLFVGAVMVQNPQMMKKYDTE